MGTRMIIAAAFVFNILLSNFCMMPMAAYAREMPMPDTMHHAAMEMASVPAADCEDCPEENAPESNSGRSTSSCDGGHCFSQAPADAMVVHDAYALEAAPVAPAVTLVIEQGALIDFLISAAPPGFLCPTETVVLRF